MVRIWLEQMFLAILKAHVNVLFFCFFVSFQDQQAEPESVHLASTIQQFLGSVSSQ